VNGFQPVTELHLPGLGIMRRVITSLFGSQLLGVRTGNYQTGKKYPKDD
jgi:hypothetical protein